MVMVFLQQQLEARGARRERPAWPSRNPKILKTPLLSPLAPLPARTPPGQSRGASTAVVISTVGRSLTPFTHRGQARPMCARGRSSCSPACFGPPFPNHLDHQPSSPRIQDRASCPLCYLDRIPQGSSARLFVRRADCSAAEKFSIGSPATVTPASISPSGTGNQPCHDAASMGQLRDPRSAPARPSHSLRHLLVLSTSQLSRKPFRSSQAGAACTSQKEKPRNRLQEITSAYFSSSP
ncbi:hypothetical protein EV126DRAFT_204238 [Verticillium dahliae]|nr:hypothetical protein EV126DRAFT_204238 [Verticillium dahliae]